MNSLVLVLLDPHSNIRKFGQFRNLVALRRDGSLAWTAQLPETTTGDHYYTLKQIDERIVANSFSGFVTDIDPDTGIVINRSFVK